MAVLSVAQMGHPVLLRPADSIADPTDPEIARLAANMQDTIEDYGANGIAGPQVYASLRIVVFRFAPWRIPPHSPVKPISWTVMINPVVTPLDAGGDLYWERCLSIPNIHGKVPRHSRIGLSYQTLLGKTEEREAVSWDAVLMQHEVDHLDGVLFTMRMRDHSTLSFNSSPGLLAEDAAVNEDLDPLLKKLADNWPTRARWAGYLSSEQMKQTNER
jgi:peptide deformylase